MSTINLSLHYCHHHQAWFGTVQRFTQTGEDDLHLSGSAGMQFGPFDTTEDVADWAGRAIGANLDAVTDHADVLHLKSAG